MALKNNLSVRWEDENLVVCDKPAGLLSIPDREQSEPSLKDLLRDLYGNIWTVHRLDRETSGLIVFAKTEAAHAFLSKQFEERSTRKWYHGLVMGRPLQEEGTVDQAILEHPVKKGSMVIHAKGKSAITHYQVLTHYHAYTLMEFEILTGRTHQIRVHSQFLGTPIVCDPLYGDGQPLLLSAVKRKFKLGKDVLEERPLLARTALHAYRLQIQHPDGTEMQWEAPYPKDLRATLQQLDKWGK
jgi:23S rRNA pseudouridine955/2504/2580 synthase/23S rRNA pseudouridine1911/1915/1917 synthase